jgi:hypothetical protein
VVQRRRSAGVAGRPGAAAGATHRLRRIRAPLIVGGTGDRILTIAAEHADIIGIAGAYQIKGQPVATFRMGTAAEARNGSGSPATAPAPGPTGSNGTC